MGVPADTGEGVEVPQQLLRLLGMPRKLREAEDIFEIANDLCRAKFAQILDVTTRSALARCAELYEMVPGTHVYLSKKGDNALYIILSGSAKLEVAGLEFLPGDTFGFRTELCPSFKLMVNNRVVTCAKKGVAARVPSEDCFKIWPQKMNDHGRHGSRSQRAPMAEQGCNPVWSPVLAKSILLRGAAEGDEVPVALEFLNFPPINGYSTELREILASQFHLVCANKGGIFREWINHVPVDPNDVRLSRVLCDSVVIVVSGGLNIMCGRASASHAPAGPLKSVNAGVLKASAVGGKIFLEGVGGGKNTSSGDTFELMRLEKGDVFPSSSGRMQRNRQRTQDEDFEQEIGEGWADFTSCALVAESDSTEVLLVDANFFNDVIYPGADLRYSMEPVREIFTQPPGERTSRQITYIARNVLSRQVAFQQMTSSAIERIASRLRDMVAAPGGEMLVEKGQDVTSFMLLLRGSASIVATAKVAKARSQLRHTKIGRLEPGDLWGMHHMQTGAKAEFDILAVESCEVVLGRLEDVRAAEKRECINRPVGTRAMRALAVPPEKRTQLDIKNIVAEMNAPGSGLDTVSFRSIPSSLKARLAAAFRLKVFPPFLELRHDVGSRMYLVIIKGSISLQAASKSKRFTMETLNIPTRGPLVALDVDNGLALEDWRGSGLGQCVAMLFERQILGEYPNSEEATAGVRAITRQETTAVVVDADVFSKRLSRIDPSDAHASVCREVLGQLQILPEAPSGVSSLEPDLMLRLLRENKATGHLETAILLKLCSAISLKRYSPGEIVTEAEDYGENLFIILEGRLKYFVKDTHRQVVDKKLAKEVGLVLGLRCIGFLTTGDFFAPTSMMSRKGRRARVIAAESYRVRCSSDMADGEVMCLVLSRQNLVNAVERSSQIQVSIYQQRLKKRSTLVGSCQFSRPTRVQFGEPKSIDEGPETDIRREEERSEEKGIPAGKPRSQGEKVVAFTKLSTFGRDGLGSSLVSSVSIEGEQNKTVMVTGTNRRPPNQQEQQQQCPHSSFSTTPPQVLQEPPATKETAPSKMVPPTSLQWKGEGKSQDYPDNLPITQNSARTVKSAVADFTKAIMAEKRQVFVTGLGLERQLNFTEVGARTPPGNFVGNADEQEVNDGCSGGGVSVRSCDGCGDSGAGGPSWANVDQTSVGGYADVAGLSSKKLESLDWKERWAESDYLSRQMCPSPHEGRRRYKTDVTKKGSGAKEAVVLGEPAGKHGGPVTGGGDALLEVLRSFVSLHVYPSKKTQSGWVSLPGNFSERFATDKQALSENLSGFDGWTNCEDTQIQKNEAGPPLKPTLMCCHQVLPPATLGGTIGCKGASTAARKSILKDAQRARSALRQTMINGAATNRGQVQGYHQSGSGSDEKTVGNSRIVGRAGAMVARRSVWLRREQEINREHSRGGEILPSGGNQDAERDVWFHDSGGDRLERQRGRIKDIQSPGNGQRLASEGEIWQPPRRQRSDGSISTSYDREHSGVTPQQQPPTPRPPSFGTGSVHSKVPRHKMEAVGNGTAKANPSSELSYLLARYKKVCTGDKSSRKKEAKPPPTRQRNHGTKQQLEGTTQCTEDNTIGSVDCCFSTESERGGATEKRGLAGSRGSGNNEKNSVRSDIGQTQPCTGTLSNEEQALLRNESGFSSAYFSCPRDSVASTRKAVGLFTLPRESVSRKRGPVVLSTDAVNDGNKKHNAENTAKDDWRGVPGAVVRSGCPSSGPKQPAVVRWLKVTLQKMNNPKEV